MITSNDILFIHRGDDVQFEFLINRGTSVNPDYYTLTSPADYLLFSICEPNQLFEDGIVRKIFNYLDNVETSAAVKPVNVVVSGNDTINLIPGTYYYSMKLCRGVAGNMTTETVLSRKKLVIVD